MEKYVTPKGQIVIPAELRKKYQIKGGTKLHVIDDGERIILMPITQEYIQSMRGLLKGTGAFRMLEQDRQAERDQ